MTTPITTHHDPHYDYEGYFKTQAFCDLLILRFGEEQQQAVVVFTECDENTGTSVTNRSEYLATRVTTEFGLDPTTTTFLEHYPKRGMTYSLREMYARLTYTWDSKSKAHCPRWQYIPLEEVERLLSGER